MSEQSERDMIVRADAQLQEQIKNLTDIRTDLNRIYDKIELEARNATITGSEIKFLKESTLQKITEIDKKIISLGEEIDSIKKDMSIEIKNREIFQESILTSFRTTKIIAIIISGFLGLIATVCSIIAFLKD